MFWVSSEQRARHKAFDEVQQQTAEVLGNPEVIARIGRVTANELLAINQAAFVPSMRGGVARATPSQDTYSPSATAVVLLYPHERPRLQTIIEPLRSVTFNHFEIPERMHLEALGGSVAIREVLRQADEDYYSRPPTPPPVLGNGSNQLTGLVTSRTVCGSDYTEASSSRPILVMPISPGEPLDLMTKLHEDVHILHRKKMPYAMSGIPAVKVWSEFRAYDHELQIQQACPELHESDSTADLVHNIRNRFTTDLGRPYMVNDFMVAAMREVNLVAV